MTTDYERAWHELILLAGDEELARAAVVEAQRTPFEPSRLARELLLAGWTPVEGNGIEFLQRLELRRLLGLP